MLAMFISPNIIYFKGKKAIEASDGDMDKAFQWLRERGSAKASDLEKREAIEGLVGVMSTDTDGAIVQVSQG